MKNKEKYDIIQDLIKKAKELSSQEVFKSDVREAKLEHLISHPRDEFTKVYMIEISFTQFIKYAKCKLYYFDNCLYRRCINDLAVWLKFVIPNLDNLSKSVIEFTDDEVKLIKSNIRHKVLVELGELDKLKKLRIKSLKDSISLTDLFVVCHHYLYINKFSLFKKDDKDTKKKLYDYLDSFVYLEELRNLLEDYGDGQGYGSYSTSELIKDSVKKHGESIGNLINLFFRIFV